MAPLEATGTGGACRARVQRQGACTQVWIGAVARGPAGTALNSTYNSRDTVEYKEDLGATPQAPSFRGFCGCTHGIVLGVVGGSCAQMAGSHHACPLLPLDHRCKPLLLPSRVLYFVAGNLVASLAGTVPDGLLVFFPSYYMLERCIEFWKGVGGGAPRRPHCCHLAYNHTQICNAHNPRDVPCCR